MNNYSCLDYWYFFWGDFCKEIQITGKQFMGLFNEAEIPNHRYSQVPQNIIEQQVLRTRPVTPKDVVIDIKKLQNDMTHKTDNKLQNNMTHKTDNKLQSDMTHKTDTKDNKLQNDMTHKTDNKLQNNMTHKTDTKDNKLQNDMTHKTDNKLQNNMTHKTDNKLQNNMTHKTDTKEIDFIKDFILISQYDNEFEVLDMV